MRHKKAVAKLGRKTDHRKAMLRNMVTSFFEFERIKTTDAKAKELRRIAEKMITLAKRGDLHSRRQALSYIRKKSVTAKLFEDIAKRYENREGGYTRIYKVGNRNGDNAPVSLIELVGKEEKVKKKKKKATKGKAKKKAAPATEAAKKEKEVTEEKPEIAESAEVETPETEIEEAAPEQEEQAAETEVAETAAIEEVKEEEPAQEEAAEPAAPE